MDGLLTEEDGVYELLGRVNIVLGECMSVIDGAIKGHRFEFTGSSGQELRDKLDTIKSELDMTVTNYLEDVKGINIRKKL